jgi:hypothetical protein
LECAHSQAGHHVTKILADNKDVAGFTKFLKDVQGADETSAANEIAAALGDADFFRTPAGQFLGSAVLTTPLSALLNRDEVKNPQTLAGKALNIINGQTLQSLFDYATKNLGLDVIQNIKTDVDKFNLDAWLQAKLDPPRKGTTTNRRRP